jgi:uncharacterized protein (TIGR02271 family)
MNKPRRVAALLIAGVVIAGLPARTQAAVPAVGSPCGLPVAVIGADVTPANLPPLRRALGVAPGTTELRETLADERAQAHGLIPPALLGIVAVSSVLLIPRPTGAGLDVTVTNDVTLDAATTYANALLTAGVTDATVRVDAPPSQQALGTTALLGLLRAAETSCTAISPARRDLAIREIALTDSLAQYVGPRGAAARLLFALKRDAVAGGLVAPAALQALIARDAAARGTAVPPALQPTLAAYLRDLVVSRAYVAIAAARPSVVGPPPLRAIVRLNGTGVGAPGAAGTARGTVTATGGARLVVRQAEGTHTYQPSSAVPVYRDGAPSNLGAIQPGDTVTITTNAAGQPTRIDAVSLRTPAAAPPAVAPTATTQGAVVRGVAAVGGAATGLAVRRANGSLRIYHPAPGVPVYRNGVLSSLGAIRRDDAVTITTDAAGRPTRIDATSTATTAATTATSTTAAAGTGTAVVAPSGHGAIVHGIAAAAVGAAGIAVTQANGTHTYRPVPGLPVYRNGVVGTLGAIRPTDAVTVTTNAAGDATRIDATSTGATTGAGAAARGAIIHGTAAAAVGVAGLTVRRSDGTSAYLPSSTVRVYRNGAPSSLGAIRLGDTVTVTTNAGGRATRIAAVSAPATARRGAIVVGAAAAAAAAGSLIVHTATGTQTYHPAAAVPVYRNGARSNLGAIRPSDTVTVTTNAAGGATRIDASSPLVAPLAGAGAPQARQGGFNPAWLWLLLPAALLLGGLLLLGLRRRGAAVVPEPAPVAMAAPVAEGDIRVPVYEEELTVGKRQTRIGDVRLRKEVVTEQQSVPVTLRHEEVTVERVPFTGQASQADSQNAFQSQDVDMAVMGEQAVADKTVREVEEVRLHKDATQVQEQVTDTVRKERVVVEGVEERDL